MNGTGAPDRPAGGASGIEISPISFSRQSGAPPKAKFGFDVRFPEYVVGRLQAWLRARARRVTATHRDVGAHGG